MKPSSGIRTAAHSAAAPAPTTDAQALFLYELARDPDDADYTPRTLIPSDTDLAA